MSSHVKKSRPASFDERSLSKIDKMDEKKVGSVAKSASATLESLPGEIAMCPIMMSCARRYVARCLPPFLRPKQLDGYTLTRRGVAHRLDTTPNQDTSFMLLPANGVRNYALLAIMDGHGAKGHSVAKMTAEFLERAFTTLLPSESKTPRPCDRAKDLGSMSITEIMEAAFRETAAGVSVSACGSDSGTTITVVLVYRGEVAVAWAGDTRAVITNGRGAIQLTTAMHRGSNSSEAKRVREVGGRLKDGYVVDKSGKVGVSVTRAVGDVDLKHIGITSVPEVQTLPFETIKGGAVIIASDGLWDASKVSPDIVANTVARRHRKKHSARRACEDLLQLACRQNEAPNDDCTITCLLFP